MAKAKLTAAREAEMKQALADLEELDEQIETLVDIGSLDAGYLEAHNKTKDKAKTFLRVFGNDEAW
tara:strand:+ start:192 stop:389 length:198 start_codon:yes stop_codon:yes gene_type:complete